jgi:hypothetical protein
MNCLLLGLEQFAHQQMLAYQAEETTPEFVGEAGRVADGVTTVL